MSERKENTVQVSQYCLDVVPAIGFVEKLSKKLKITNLAFRATYRMGRRKLAIPEYLKKVGVSNVAEIASSLDIRGTFRNGMQRETMIKTMRRTATLYRVPAEKFHIERLVLTDLKPTCSVSFKRMYKQIRLPNDRRKKKLVLGMTNGDGKNYHNILATLSAKKIVCTLAKTERTIVMCSEEIVVKK